HTACLPPTPPPPPPPPPAGNRRRGPCKPSASNPAALVTSTNCSVPVLRNRRNSPCPSTSPTAARSSHPSLSTSRTARPHPRVHGCCGICRSSKPLPSRFFHTVRPGRLQCEKARSIQPSLLKSKATAPAVGPGKFDFHRFMGRNGPSRVFEYVSGAAPSPVRTKSTARSLLKSVASAPTSIAAPASPGVRAISVKLPFPLLRQSRLPGLTAVDAVSTNLDMYK